MTYVSTATRFSHVLASALVAFLHRSFLLRAKFVHDLSPFLFMLADAARVIPKSFPFRAILALDSDDTVLYWRTIWTLFAVLTFDIGAQKGRIVAILWFSFFFFFFFFVFVGRIWRDFARVLFPFQDDTLPFLAFFFSVSL